MEPSGTLQQAIDSVRAGDKPHAARMLAQYVTQNPSDETAWLWLAASLEDPQKQAYCLQKAKTLDPSNPGNMEELEFYLGLAPAFDAKENPINLPPPVEEQLSPAPSEEPQYAPAEEELSPLSPVEESPGPGPVESPTNPTPKLTRVQTGLSRTQTIILIVLLIIVIVIVAVLASLVFGGGSLPFSPENLTIAGSTRLLLT